MLTVGDFFAGLGGATLGIALMTAGLALAFLRKTAPTVPGALILLGLTLLSSATLLRVDAAWWTFALISLTGAFAAVWPWSLRKNPR